MAGPPGRAVVLVEGLEGGIAFAVKRRRHLGETLAHGLVHHAMPDGRGIEAAAVEFDGVVAVHEDVVEDLVVAPAAQERRALHLVEDIAEDLRAADAVIHVNAHRAHPDAAGVMNKIVADAIAAIGVVAPGVDGADVACLQGIVVDLVEFDDVVVAVEEDRAVGVVVDEVVRGTLADAAHEHRRHVALGPAALAGEMAVLDKVSAGPECLPVAAVQGDAAVAGVEDVAAQDAMAGAAFNGDAVVADVADEAAGDEVAGAATDLDSAAAAGFEFEAAQGDIGDVRELQQRFGQEGE